MFRFSLPTALVTVALFLGACTSEPALGPSKTPQEESGLKFEPIQPLTENSTQVALGVETHLAQFFPSGNILGYAADDTSIVTILGPCASFKKADTVFVTATYANGNTAVHEFPVKDFSRYLSTGGIVAIGTISPEEQSCHDAF